MLLAVEQVSELRCSKCLLQVCAVREGASLENPMKLGHTVPMRQMNPVA